MYFHPYYSLRFPSLNTPISVLLPSQILVSISLLPSLLLLLQCFHPYHSYCIRYPSSTLLLPPILPSSPPPPFTTPFPSSPSPVVLAIQLIIRLILPFHQGNSLPTPYSWFQGSAHNGAVQYTFYICWAVTILLFTSVGQFL